MTMGICGGLCMHGLRVIAIIGVWCFGFGVGDGRAIVQPAALEKIRHIIVIYQENWSFDGLYGRFPGAEGIANAGERIRQIKKDGTPYTTLPQPLDTSKKPPIPDARFPADLPVGPYDIAPYVPPHQKIGDIVNRALQEKRQINGGRMDGFVAWSENGGLALSYYDATNLRSAAWLSNTRWRITFPLGIRRLAHQSPMAGLRLHAEVAGRPSESEN